MAIRGAVRDNPVWRSSLCEMGDASVVETLIELEPISCDLVTASHEGSNKSLGIQFCVRSHEGVHMMLRDGVSLDATYGSLLMWADDNASNKDFCGELVFPREDYPNKKYS